MPVKMPVGTHLPWGPVLERMAMSRFARSALWSIWLASWLLLAPACSPPPKPRNPITLRLVTVPSARPLADRLGGEYGKRQPAVRVEVSEADPEAALAAVASGQADLALVDYSLDPAESRDPETGRRDLRAWHIASDGLAVVVHPTNPVQRLSSAQIALAFEGIERQWSHLGGNEGTLRLVSREAGAPARLTFERGFLRDAPLSGLAVVMPGDEAVADYVASHPDAIGYLGMAWLGPRVKAVAVDGVPPSPATVAGGTYPLALPLALVTRTGAASKSRAFVDYALSRAGQVVISQLYAPAPRS